MMPAEEQWNEFVHALAIEIAALGKDPNRVLAPNASRLQMRALVRGQPGTGDYCSATVPIEMLRRESAGALANAFVGRWLGALSGTKGTWDQLTQDE
jgi:hypothetical protein